MTQIRAIESTAMLVQEPQPGLQELMSYLEGKGVRMAICTRNFEYVWLSFQLSKTFGRQRGNALFRDKISLTLC